MSTLTRSPEIILIEGPSRTGKTTAGSIAADALRACELNVVSKDAGSFFRIVTQLTLGELAAKSIDEFEEADLDHASKEVLQTGAPFDVERTWQGLHEPYIDHMVGKVSRAEHVQAASRQWWDITADRATAAGADALVLDGRNPRSRLMPWLTQKRSGITLELFCECDPTIAAERTLRGNGVAQPTDMEIAKMEASIVNRREIDSARTSQPYCRPTSFIEYGSRSAEELVEQARSDGTPELPLPIRVDTGMFALVSMNAAVRSLVLAATSLVQ